MKYNKIICLIIALWPTHGNAANFVVSKENMAKFSNGIAIKVYEPFTLNVITNGLTKSSFLESISYLYEYLPFATNYLEDGCHIKGRLVSEWLTMRNINHGLIFLYPKASQGKYTITSEKTSKEKEVLFECSLSVLGPISNKEISWNYHVAPFLVNATGQLLLFDHTFEDSKPLQLNDWLNKFRQINPDNFEILVTSSNYIGIFETVMAVKENNTLSIKKSSFTKQEYDFSTSCKIYITMNDEPNENNVDIQLWMVPRKIPLMKNSDYASWREEEFLPTLKPLQKKILNKNSAFIKSLLTLGLLTDHIDDDAENDNMDSSVSNDEDE